MSEVEISEWMNSGIISLTKNGYNELITVGFMYEMFADKIKKEINDTKKG